MFRKPIIIRGEATLDKAIEAGRVTVSGKKESLSELVARLDKFVSGSALPYPDPEVSWECPFVHKGKYQKARGERE